MLLKWGLLSLLWLLQSCGDSTKMGGAYPTSDRGLQPSNWSATPSGQKQGTTVGPLASATTETVSAEGNFSPDAAEGVPAVLPTIVAQVQLTCTINASSPHIQCATSRNGIPVDLLPKGLYLISGAAAVWTPLAMKTVQLGVYKAQLPRAHPTSFMVGMELPESQYVLGRVGTGPLEYRSIVQDGSFEALTYTDFYFASALTAQGSPWMVEKNEVKPCVNGEASLHVLFEPNLEIHGTWSRVVNMSFPCSPSQTTNVKLSQKLTVEKGHIYLASFFTRLETASSPNVLKVGLGKAATINVTGTEWRQSEINYVADTDSVSISFQDDNANSQGTRLDDVKLLDLGKPR